jgi:hypothetical protein
MRKCFVAWVVLTLVAASSVIAAERSSLEKLSQLLEAEKLRADHIILVDLSGSMAWRAERGSKKRASPGQSRLDTLLQALPALLNAIPRGDYVVVLGFHGDVIEDPSMLVSEWRGPDSVTSLVDALKKRLSLGRDTDLGRALEGAKKHVERPGGNPLQFVYFLTDGQHDAPKTSPYAAEDAPAWEAAKKDWAGLHRSHNIYVYLFGLYDVAKAGVLAQVLPGLNFLSFQGAGDLKTFFSTEMAHLQNNRIGLLLDKERRAGALSASLTDERIDLGSGRAVVNLDISSTYPHLAVSGALDVKAGAGPEGLVVAATGLDKRFYVPSKGARQLTVQLEAAPTEASFLSLKSCMTGQLPLTISPSGSALEPGADIEGVGLASHRSTSVDPFSVAIPISRCEGFWPRWVLMLPLALLLLAAAIICRLWPRKVSASVEWLDVPRGQAQPSNQTLRKLREIRIGSDPGCAVQASFLPPVLAIVRRKPVWVWGGQTFLSIRAPGVEVSGRPCDPGAEMSLRGSRDILVERASLRIRPIS